MRSTRLWMAGFLCVSLAAILLGVAGWSGLRAAAMPDRGLNTADLDKTCKPCEDFYKYSNGGWLASHPIPAAFPSYGHFNSLSDKNQDVLHEILEAAAKNPGAPGSVGQKIGDFYGSCTDTDKIEAAGITPIQPDLDRIAKIADAAGLQAEIARLHAQGNAVLFGFNGGPDEKDSAQVIGLASQGGLGLPDRDYYTKDDAKSVKLREQYAAHVGKMLELAGDSADAAAAESKAVMNIETQLAQASVTRVQRRDPEANYHKMTAAELGSMTPDFSWPRFFTGIGYPTIAVVDVGQPKFFQAVDGMLGSVSLGDWKSYLRWHVLHTAASSLSEKFVQEDFAFFGRTMTGAQEMQPRWKRCTQTTDRMLGEALGQKYVAKVFPPAAKARATVMVHNLIAALRADIETLDWMGPETRKQALYKLDHMGIKIGYPDKWRDYSGFHVARASYAENVRRGREFGVRFSLSAIGKPTDRSRWGMTPPTVNASYNPTRNEITFPAGILQPPFFDPNSDDALNYGGMGSVIGHEMTHGFDDQGAKFDADGNLKNWWSTEDLKNFQARAECVAKQFDGYVVVDDLHENGHLVLGESIADLGGLTIAHAALERAIAGKPQPLIDGLTPDQRFFIAWARIWGANERPESMRLHVATDPHADGKWRAIGAPSNMPIFAKAFSCSATDPMVRPEDSRCRIW